MATKTENVEKIENWATTPVKRSKSEKDEKNWTATEIAMFINNATTPSQKGTATKRLKAYVTRRAEEGCDPSRVEANVRSLCKRLGRG